MLAAQTALGRLLASHPDLDELFILGSAEQLPRCDFYLPLLSAPVVLGTRASTIPCEVPYLWADPELTAQWGKELARIDGFKIGIAWQGSRDFAADRWRSIPLAHFAPLASLPGVRLISLQKGYGAEQVATVDFPVLDLASRLDEVAGPFMDTAAVIRSLDLVVTSDTAIAHLAGRWACPFGLRCSSRPIGGGCASATTLPGIPPCDSSAKPRRAGGRTFLSALPRPSRHAARKRYNR